MVVITPQPSTLNPQPEAFPSRWYASPCGLDHDGALELVGTLPSEQGKAATILMG